MVFRFVAVDMVLQGRKIEDIGICMFQPGEAVLQPALQVHGWVAAIAAQAASSAVQAEPLEAWQRTLQRSENLLIPLAVFAIVDRKFLTIVPQAGAETCSPHLCPIAFKPILSPIVVALLVAAAKLGTVDGKIAGTAEFFDLVDPAFHFQTICIRAPRFFPSWIRTSKAMRVGHMNLEQQLRISGNQ